ncbi:zf-HC2 domain-containing protein [Myxococcota bacterium]|nr:zf-HC2 domain-containing protein [Myxococcota bacterium]
MSHPVSHLRLERYHLGELPPADRDGVARHLETCAECRTLLDEIAADDRPLPDLPLPDLPTLEVEPAGGARGGVVRGPARWWAVGGGALLALAAGAVLVLRAPGPLPPGEVAWKGGVLAVELARERDGQVHERPATYRDGDRIQVRVSCPPGEQVGVGVRQGDEWSWPLPPVACGNRVVAGALALSGGQQTAICAVADPVAGTAPPPGQAACVVLRGE